MRAAFSDALVELGQSDSRVVLLTGDHGYALFDAFRKACPNQFINAGIAEQNMVGMAAGLARTGFRPFVYGLSAFVPVRVLEQIKLDIAHDALPVVLIGDGAGLVYSYLGTSHQSTEDIACVRAIPNMTVFSPADRHEMTACMRRAHALGSPIYIRVGKSDRGDVHASTPMLGTSPLKVRCGRPEAPAFFATGSMVRTAMDLAETHYPDAAVYSVACIKPLTIDAVRPLVAGRSYVVTLEEHSVHGGMGSAIAGLTAREGGTRLLQIGVDDRFSHHCGSYDYLLREHRLDAASVLGRIQEFVHAI